MIDPNAPPPLRLRALRDHAGYSMEELARKIGYKGSSGYQRYETPDWSKSPEFKVSFVRKLAEALVGRGDPPIEEHDVLALAGVQKGMALLPTPKRKKPAGEPASRAAGMASVDELDIMAGAGPGGSIDPELLVDGEVLREVVPTLHVWSMPSELIRQVTSSPAESVKIITIIGNSMVPDLAPGSKVMVDTADRTPSPPGVFVVWDGMAFVAKIIEYIPFSEPPKVRIKSKNPDYSEYERTLDEAYIQGRVVGRWQWT